MKLFFLSILIFNIFSKCKCNECFDFQCFDGGKSKTTNCFQCKNVSLDSRNRWLEHIDQMIYIYRMQKKYEVVKNLEIKKVGGMYCCSIDSKTTFNLCSLSLSYGAQGGVPHFGLACRGYDFWYESNCKNNQLGHRCCQMNHCNIPNNTELQFMMTTARKIFPIIAETDEKEKYKYLIIIFASLISITILAIILFCHVKFFRKGYQRTSFKKFLCLLKFFVIIRNYKNRKNQTTNGEYDSRMSRKQSEINKIDNLDYLSCSGSGAGKPLMTKRTASTEINLIRPVGEGRFGTVWLGKWNGDDVAVKIFSTRDERSWDREKQIYQKNFLRHNNVLGYVATDSRDNGMATELWLVTDYHENGSLYDYLRSHVLSVEQAVKMVRSITNGLAHLHMEINGTELRPGIAHRDLKSRNILVKSCGECCIGDLGLAVRLNEDFTALDGTRVGTRRYMAPEVIMDKIVLSDLQYNGGLEAFKKADIYSYSLVLWEILRCCECPSMKIEASAHEMPYQNLVSNDPSLSEIRDIVCDKKLRPELNPNCNNLNPLKDISKCIQESWFDEPASRLTIMRLKKIMSNAWNEVLVLQSTIADISSATNHPSKTMLAQVPPPAAASAVALALASAPLPPLPSAPQAYKYQGTTSSNFTMSTDFSPLSMASTDIPNIVIKTKDNVLFSDPYSSRQFEHESSSISPQTMT